MKVGSIVRTGGLPAIVVRNTDLTVDRALERMKGREVVRIEIQEEIPGMTMIVVEEKTDNSLTIVNQQG